MDDFIKILEISIWPIVVLVGMFLFQRDLGSVLGRLTKVETSAAKLMFNEDIKKAQSEVSEAVGEDEESKTWLSEMLEIAKLNPRAAMIEAWTAIEILCIEIGMVQGATMPRFRPKLLEEFLNNIPDFDEKSIKQVTSLWQLRNRVMHGRDADFDFIDAEKYIILADKTLNVLNAANKKIQDGH